MFFTKEQFEQMFKLLWMKSTFTAFRVFSSQVELCQILNSLNVEVKYCFWNTQKFN